MGNEICIYASAGGHELVGRLAPQQVPVPDTQIELAIDTGRLHFFDAATGTRL